MPRKLIEADHVSIKIGQDTVLKELSFTIYQHQGWAITGPSGSGKTLVGQAIMHYLPIHAGILKRYLSSESRLVMVNQQHPYKTLTHAGDPYYQARFNSCDSEDSPVVEDLLKHVLQKNTTPDRQALSTRMEEVLGLLKIEYLRKTRLIKLSNGENKRFQIAQALLRDPEVLILDNPFLGLDVEARKILHAVLDHLMQAGMTLILMTTPTEIPQKISHIMELEAGTVKHIHSHASFMSRKKQEYKNKPLVSFDPDMTEVAGAGEDTAFSVAVKMRQVTVTYGGRKILDAVDWQINKGDRWALSGPNGAGKSTLLSLINGDNPQAYANEIYLFDRKKGSGESIWDIKRRIGFISPELHLYFNRSMTCFEAIASGFSDKMVLNTQLTETQKTTIRQWMTLLQIPHLEKRRLTEIPLGEQRLVLLVRALVKNPPMLILDEPCQGLDTEQTARITLLVDTVCQHFGKTLIYVSHYPDDLPPCVNHFLFLEKGKVQKRQTVSRPSA